MAVAEAQPHSLKRRRVALDEEASQKIREPSLHGRLQDFISSCWATDKAKGHVDHENVCKVRVVQSENAGRSLALTEDVSPGQLVLYLSPCSLFHSGRLKSVLPPLIVPNKSTRSDPDQPTKVPLQNTALLPLVLAICKVNRRKFQTMPNQLEQFSSFFESLPSEFDTVPLVWRRCKEDGPLKNISDKLLSALPSSSKELLDRMDEKYSKDLHKARWCYESQGPDIAARLGLQQQCPTWTDEDFLWGWLCVNSRCLYLPLGLEPHGENFTMAPLLDMANHATDVSVQFQATNTEKGGLRLRAPPLDQAQRLSDGSSSNGWRGLSAGDPVTITYGPHSNTTLLLEYGFVLCDEAGSSTNQWSDYRLDAAIGGAIERLALSGPGDGSLDLEALLREHGYWKNWTLQADKSAEPYPSYPTVMALRLLAICQLSEDDEKLVEANVKRWKKVVTGLLPGMSKPVELATTMLLSELLEGELKRIEEEHAGKVLDSVEAIIQDAPHDQRQMLITCCKLVRAIRKEEQDLLRGTLTACRKAVEAGEPVW